MKRHEFLRSQLSFGCARLLKFLIYYLKESSLPSAPSIKSSIAPIVFPIAIANSRFKQICHKYPELIFAHFVEFPEHQPELDFEVDEHALPLLIERPQWA